MDEGTKGTNNFSEVARVLTSVFFFVVFFFLFFFFVFFLHKCESFKNSNQFFLGNTFSSDLKIFKIKISSFASNYVAMCPSH